MRTEQNNISFPDMYIAHSHNAWLYTYKQMITP